MLAHQGTFTAKTSTGSQAYTGVGFQPKAMMFWSTLQTSDGFGGVTLSFMMFGFAGSDNSNGVAGWAADDNVSSSNFGVIDQGSCIGFVNAATPAQLGQALLTSMDSDGFTLNWTQAAGSAWTINYLALGGDSIERSRAGPLFINASPADQSTGNPSFRPNFIMVINGDDPCPSFGMASSSGQACMYWFEQDNANPSNIKQTWSPGNLIGGYRTVTVPSNIVPDFLASFTGFTATGFSYNCSDLPAGTRAALYFAIKGGSHTVGTSNVPASTGNQTLTATAAVQAAGFFSNMKAAATDDSFLSWGATDGTNNRVTAYLSQDNAHNTVTDMYNANHLLLAGVTMATPSADSLADISSFNDRDCVLNWTAVSGTQEEFAYWLLGPGGGTPGQIIRYR